MFKNTFQSGFLSIMYSIGSKPLQIWDKKVRLPQLHRSALEMVANKLQPTTAESGCLVVDIWEGFIVCLRGAWWHLRSQHRVPATATSPWVGVATTLASATSGLLFSQESWQQLDSLLPCVSTVDACASGVR